MAKYRAEITWEFDFDEKGILQNEYDYLDEDDDFSRTPEQMEEYAKTELLEALYNSVKYNELYSMIDVVAID